MSNVEKFNKGWKMSANNKREKFKELAKSRVNKATTILRLISNLSNKSIYKYEQADVKKIVDHLKKEIRAIEDRFNSKKRSSEEFEI